MRYARLRPCVVRSDLPAVAAAQRTLAAAVSANPSCSRSSTVSEERHLHDTLPMTRASAWRTRAHDGGWRQAHANLVKSRIGRCLLVSEIEIESRERWCDPVTGGAQSLRWHLVRLREQHAPLKRCANVRVASCTTACSCSMSSSSRGGGPDTEPIAALFWVPAHRMEGFLCQESDVCRVLLRQLELAREHSFRIIS